MSRTRKVVVSREFGGHDIDWHAWVTFGSPATRQDPEEPDEVSFVKAILTVLAPTDGSPRVTIDIIDLVIDLIGDDFPQPLIDAALEAAGDA